MVRSVRDLQSLNTTSEVIRRRLLVFVALGFLPLVVGQGRRVIADRLYPCQRDAHGRACSCENVSSQKPLYIQSREGVALTSVDCLVLGIYVLGLDRRGIRSQATDGLVRVVSSHSCV